MDTRLTETHTMLEQEKMDVLFKSESLLRGCPVDVCQAAMLFFV